MIYYLEMNSPNQLNPKTDSKELDIVECEIKQFEINKFMYEFVGKPWDWFEKLVWTDKQWSSLINSPNHRTWIAYYKGSIAGYFELLKDNQDVEILYFGLTPAFTGKGFGGYLLTKAITAAWEWTQTKRVWVHTCTEDHPNALNNYQSRGMNIYKKSKESTK
jgi:RimJ/RimL family protein N-acetyltransferase